MTKKKGGENMTRERIREWLKDLDRRLYKVVRLIEEDNIDEALHDLELVRFSLLVLSQRVVQREEVKTNRRR
jgi:hypothetical protein